MAVTYSQNGVIVKPTGFDVIGGKKYKTVRMPDGKIWLAENLDFKFCTIGGSGTPSTPNAWYYNNDETTYGWNGYKCGLLYNWYAVKVLNDNRSELIPGWHVPTKNEFEYLISVSGDTDSDAAFKLKASNLSWANSWQGSDLYGFKVVPSGYYVNGFWDVNTNAGLWTTTEGDSGEAYVELYNANAGSSAPLYPRLKTSGFSIRLVRDA